MHEVIRVFPVGIEWIVTFRRGQLTKQFANREAAEAFARQIANANRPSSLQILGPLGVVETEERFGVSL